jgi:tricarballylate dehydrogenase
VSEGRDIVVVGQGGAGLCAALAAAEAAHSASIRVTILEKAAEGDAGGNTRWTPAYMRAVEPGFVRDVLEATGSRGDEAYFSALAAEAPATLEWIAARGVEFHRPTYYLAKGPSRIQPVGGGEALHRGLYRAARAAGVAFRHSSAARDLVLKGEKLAGVRLDGGETVAADAVVLACGGFQANAAMRRECFGPGGEDLPLLAPRARFNTGDGVAMARALGADESGDWNGMHIEPVDPRSRSSAPVVLLYPYGIVVDRAGQRFFDEGRGLVHETWEWLSRHIHFSLEGRRAWAILDSRVLSIPDWQRATRSEVPPHEARTLEDLARGIGVDAAGLAASVSAYNAACMGSPARFDATRCDGLAASGALQPPKSNWARSISVPPFLAWPLIGAVAYTFGGVATDARARVLKGGTPIPGVYAAGEITGHFYGTAPNAVAVLRALVFGRRAGLDAVSFLAG